MSYVTTESVAPVRIPIRRLWRRLWRSFGVTESSRATALRQFQREHVSPHLMRDMGVIDTHDPGAHLALMPPGRLHYPYF